MRNDLELTPWVIFQKGSGWGDEFCESIFFIGNGRMGIRGYASSEPAHRPIQKGVYLAGIFGEIKPGKLRGKQGIANHQAIMQHVEFAFAASSSLYEKTPVAKAERKSLHVH